MWIGEFLVDKSTSSIEEILDAKPRKETKRQKAIKNYRRFRHKVKENGHKIPDEKLPELFDILAEF